MLRLKWVILWTLWAGRIVRQPTAPIKISNGLVRGTVEAGGYVQYTGIPYATVVNRFQAPGPEPTWEGVFDAVNEHVQCVQLEDPFQEAVHFDFSSVKGQEDCLVVNVYTPIGPPKPLPVLVFIHGGAFQQGGGVKSLYGPEYLVKKGVILVTLNYRLNMAGFLCLGIKEAPGNAAMKDQVAALKWVQKNIRAFGGDPDNVTLFGESAGSACVSLHVVSPMSKGLFHRTIQQSGSSIASWAIQYNPVDRALFKAKALGYTNTAAHPYDLYEFFMNKTDAESVIRLTEREEGNTAQSRTIFVPCIEEQIEGVESFLTEAPMKLLKEGRFNKVPMIIGSNVEEGIMFLNVENEKYLPQLKIETTLPSDLEYPNDEVKKKIADEVQSLYFGDEEISEKTNAKLAKCYGEPFFNFPAIIESELIMKTNKNPVYNYLFNYEGWRNFAKFLMKKELRKLSGATHADELFYLFSQDLTPTLLEHKMIDVMTTMWTNFAKYGNPTPAVTDLLPISWPALTPADKRSLHIEEQFTTAPLWYNNSTLPYWKDVFEKYRRRL